jgi:hypothetical protein
LDSSDNGRNLARRRGAAQSGADDEISAAPLFAVGQLRIEDRPEPNSTHSGSAQHPLTLESQRCRYDNDAIDTINPIGLEEQRDIEHDKLCPPGSGTREKPMFSRAHHWVQNFFHPPQRIRFTEHLRPKVRPVDRAIFTLDTGESLLDSGNGLAALGHQSVHLSIGIVKRHAEPAQHRGGGTLTHADRAGEPEDNHVLITGCP